MKDLNTDNIFLKYTEAIEKNDLAEVARLEKEAKKGVTVKSNRIIRHVSLRQQRAIRR